MKVKNEDDFFFEYQPKHKIYHSLMRHRINEILLVSSVYDSFIIEEDVSLSDQIFEEFHNLNLRTFPHIWRASSVNQALSLLKERNFDLVIVMRRLGEINPWAFAEKVKQIHDIPVVLLLNNYTEIQYLKTSSTQNGSIDKVFVWNRNSSVFVAIIKLLEDRMNVDEDTINGDVRVIIVVEDSIHFYSLYLPVLYTEIMHQTHDLIQEGGNDYHSLLKMRTRPKILLASTYEEAARIYEKYKDFVLGLITDIKFPKNGAVENEAGLELVRSIRSEASTLPIMLQSSDESMRERAENLKSYFVNKKNRLLDHELRNFMQNFMGFGPFTFRLPNDKIVGVANNLYELREVIEKAPLESVIFHANHNHFSGWLYARGEFEIARQLKPRKVSEFENAEDLRQIIIASIDKILQKRLGLIVDFERSSYQPSSQFVRLRPGSLGGKGRGMAFLLYLRNLYHSGFNKEFPGISIRIPKTFVIGTDEFEQFMQQNHLYELAFSELSDETIKEQFVNAKISASLRSDLEFIFKDINLPLAVRSSNTFEDSLYQPFAGVFATYMMPNCNPSIDERINQLATAIKLVYASTYLKLARSYAETMGISLGGSRMAVIIQEVVGRQYQDRFYPNYSGTATSYNYYPLGDHLQPEDRIAYLVLGLGKTIVDGGLAKRFSPKHPEVNIYSDVEQSIRESQRDFYAINLKCQQNIDLEEGENAFLEKYDLRTAIQDRTLTEIADTYNSNDRSFSSGFWNEQAGYPVITFNRQLKYGTFPMAQILNRVLILGEKAMGCPVEIEFAGCFSEDENEASTFYLLQLRPFLENESILTEEIQVTDSDLLAFSSEVSGNHAINDIQDVVYIKPAVFDHTQTMTIAQEVGQINQKLAELKRPYILIGPGRWGTHDRHLGIPIDWTTISEARAIMEVDLPDFQVDHSQGSHFFHNIISAGIPYLCIKHNSKTDFLDWVWLENASSVEETEHVRHIRTASPFLVVVNGVKREGRIIKPSTKKK